MLVTGGHTWLQEVTLVTIEVKDLNNNSLYGIHYQFIFDTAGHIWSQLVTLVLSRSVTSTMMALCLLWPYGP